MKFLEVYCPYNRPGFNFEGDRDTNVDCVTISTTVTSKPCIVELGGVMYHLHENSAPLYLQQDNGGPFYSDPSGRAYGKSHTGTNDSGVISVLQGIYAVLAQPFSFVIFWWGDGTFRIPISEIPSDYICSYSGGSSYTASTYDLISTKGNSSTPICMIFPISLL